MPAAESASGPDGPAEDGALLVTHAGAVATVVLHHPRRRNAMTRRMWQQFPPLLEGLADDDAVKVVVVRGAGKDFSAGADITDLQNILQDPETGGYDGGALTVGEDALAAFPKPTIAAVDGYCLGGAWQIAAACDIRVASERAVFGITPAKIGIIYPLSGIERLVRLVGPAAAKYLLFTGDFQSADTALGLGLVARVVPQDQFEAEVDAVSRRLADRSQLSVRAMKDLVDTIAGGGTGLAERSRLWQQEAAASDDPRAGITAFLAKEEPVFGWAGPQTAALRRFQR